MKQEELFSKQEKELIYLGASIAAGCTPCTKYHVKKSKDVGLSDTEIDEVIKNTASMVNSFAVEMEAVARHENKKTISDDFVEDKENQTRENILVSLAASYSVRSEFYFRKHIKIAKIHGIIDSEICEIVKLSGFVIDKARAHVDMLVDKLKMKNTEKNNSRDDNCNKCDC
ncbi:MAG: hypothetical protein GY756_05365 [bacterium]|nr:hypothetical protein [bacterium]